MFKLKEYVLEIAKTGSISQAAENLFVSQPSLSASVKRLEERIGEPLFDRSTRPIRLTECGEEYVRTARAIGTAEENFLFYLDEHRNCRVGSLVLGGSSLNVNYVVPSLHKRFRESFPQIDVSIVESGIDELQQKLTEGDVDLVIDSGSMDEERFCEYPYKPETLLLAVPSHFACNERMRDYALRFADIRADRHASPDVPDTPLQLLEDTPFLTMSPETETGRRSREIFRRSGWQPNGVMTFSQMATAFHMACSGIGATMVSDFLLKSVRFEPPLCYYKLNAQDSSRFIKLYQKKGRRTSFAMRAFIELAQSS